MWNKNEILNFCNDIELINKDGRTYEEEEAAKIRINEFTEKLNENNVDKLWIPILEHSQKRSSSEQLNFLGEVASTLFNDIYEFDHDKGKGSITYSIHMVYIAFHDVWRLRLFDRVGELVEKALSLIEKYVDGDCSNAEKANADLDKEVAAKVRWIMKKRGMIRIQEGWVSIEDLKK